MSEEFIRARDLDMDWLIWIGQPMLFDGGLYVNREEVTPELQQRIRRSHLTIEVLQK